MSYENCCKRQYKQVSNINKLTLAVILGVSVSTMPRTPSLRSLFLALFFFLWPSAQCSRLFSQHFLLTPVTKDQFKTWMCFSPQVLSFHTHQIIISFSRMVKKRSIKIIKKSCEMSKESLSRLFRMDNIPRKCINFYIRFCC